MSDTVKLFNMVGTSESVGGQKHGEWYNSNYWNPHNINMRSLVIPNNSKINIDIEGDSDINLSVDSRMYSVNCSNQIEIFKADFTIGTIKFDNDNFYKRLREKLFWGQDMRNKNTKK